MALEDLLLQNQNATERLLQDDISQFSSVLSVLLLSCFVSFFTTHFNLYNALCRVHFTKMPTTLF